MQVRLDDGHQRFQLSKPFVADAVADTRPVLAAAYQAGVLENSEVFGYRRLRERQFIHNLAAYPRFLQRQHSENTNPGRVPQRLRQFRQLLIRLRALETLNTDRWLSLGRWTA